MRENYFLPVQLEGEQVLFEMPCAETAVAAAEPIAPAAAPAAEPIPESKWLLRVEGPVRSRGLRLRADPEMASVLGEEYVVPWGCVVQGTQVNEGWVQVGQYYLPVYLRQHGRVLWPQLEAAPSTIPMSSAKTIRLCLVAPDLDKSGHYRVEGTLLGGWECHAKLDVDVASGNQSILRRLNKRLH